MHATRSAYRLAIQLVQRFRGDPAAVLIALSEYFVYECDEYDRNFAFEPTLSIITALDYDHVDTLRNSR